MGIEEELKEIKAELKEKKEVKEFRLPWKAKVGKAKAKKNWVGILKINENGNINASKQQIIEQTIVIDDVPRLATANYVLRWKKYPVIIMPSWSTEPFSPVANKEKSLEDGSNIAGYRLLMNRMKLNVDVKKGLGGNWWKWLLGIGLAAIIGYALITGGGK